MASQDPEPSVSSLALSEEDFLANLKAHGKWKKRSQETHHNIHKPELKDRFSPSLKRVSFDPTSSAEDDASTQHPNLYDTAKIEVVYLGDSMLERLKTTGESTLLHQLPQSFNAGCGGDQSENVIYRLSQGLYDTLIREQEKGHSNCDIKLWIIASGTNNLRIKRWYRQSDVHSWKMVVESCLRIAPTSTVVACDVFYRKDLPDELVDDCNEHLEEAVEEINRELRGSDGGQGKERVKWVEVRKLIKQEMLVDHVHLNEEGYGVWEGVLWPYVTAALENRTS